LREILRRLGQEVEELPLGGELTRCCGYGGLSWQANPDLGEAIALERAGDAGGVLLSYCSMCRDRLRAVGKPSLHALDLLFPEDAGKDWAEKAALRPAPGISERRWARLMFRARMLEKFWGEAAGGGSMEEIRLNISGEVEKLLEKRRILHADIRKVLRHGGSGRFVHSRNGHVLSCLRPRRVTFWVEHTLDGDGSHTIHNAWCHRMLVPGVPEAENAGGGHEG
jgi:hypothetical protein